MVNDLHDIQDILLSKGFTIGKDDDFPKEGVTLAEIDNFILEAGGETVFHGKCTGAVNEIMMHLTKDCSYCTYLSRRNKSRVSSLE